MDGLTNVMVIAPNTMAKSYFSVSQFATEAKMSTVFTPDAAYVLAPGVKVSLRREDVVHRFPLNPATCLYETDIKDIVKSGGSSVSVPSKRK